MVESLTLLEVVEKEFWQEVSSHPWELALVEVAIHVDNSLHWEEADFPSSSEEILRSFHQCDGLAMFKSHRLGLCSVVTFRHVRRWTMSCRNPSAPSALSLLKNRILVAILVYGEKMLPGRRMMVWDWTHGASFVMAVCHPFQKWNRQNNNCRTSRFSLYMISTMKRSAVSLERNSIGNCFWLPSVLPPWWIHGNHVDLVRFLEVWHLRAQQNRNGGCSVFHIVKEQIGDGQKVGGFLLSDDRLLVESSVIRGLYLFLQIVYYEAACTWCSHLRFRQAQGCLLYDEIRQSVECELTCIANADWRSLVFLHRCHQTCGGLQHRQTQSRRLMTLVFWRNRMPFFILFKSSNTSFTIALLRGVSRVTSSPFSVGKETWLTLSKSSPVSALPSFSYLLVPPRQRNSSGMMDSKACVLLLALYIPTVSSCIIHLQKNIHVICSMRCASHWYQRLVMIFCRRFTILFTAISYFISFSSSLKPVQTYPVRLNSFTIFWAYQSCWMERYQGYQVFKVQDTIISIFVWEEPPKLHALSCIIGRVVVLTLFALSRLVTGGWSKYMTYNIKISACSRADSFPDSIHRTL